jgi:hypothetical protein
MPVLPQIVYRARLDSGDVTDACNNQNGKRLSSLTRPIDENSASAERPERLGKVAPAEHWHLSTNGKLLVMSRLGLATESKHHDAKLI